MFKDDRLIPSLHSCAIDASIQSHPVSFSVSCMNALLVLLLGDISYCPVYVVLSCTLLTLYTLWTQCLCYFLCIIVIEYLLLDADVNLYIL